MGVIKFGKEKREEQDLEKELKAKDKAAAKQGSENNPYLSADDMRLIHVPKENKTVAAPKHQLYYVPPSGRRRLATVRKRILRRRRRRLKEQIDEINRELYL